MNCVEFVGSRKVELEWEGGVEEEEEGGRKREGTANDTMSPEHKQSLRSG